MEPSKTPTLSNKTYDRLKFFALVILPASGSLYYGLAGIWNLPAADNVVGTVMVLDTFLGVVLGLSSKKYKELDSSYDGDLEVDEQDSRLIYGLELRTPPEELAGKKTISLKVIPRHSAGYDED